MKFKNSRAIFRVRGWTKKNVFNFQINPSYCSCMWGSLILAKIKRQKKYKQFWAFVHYCAYLCLSLPQCSRGSYGPSCFEFTSRASYGPHSLKSCKMDPKGCLKSSDTIHANFRAMWMQLIFCFDSIHANFLKLLAELAMVHTA